MAARASIRTSADPVCQAPRRRTPSYLESAGWLGLGEVGELLSDVGVAAEGGVLVAEGGLGGGVADAGHEFGEGGSGAGG